jgi:hypothetical protein
MHFQGNIYDYDFCGFMASFLRWGRAHMRAHVHQIALARASNAHSEFDIQSMKARLAKAEESCTGTHNLAM